VSWQPAAVCAFEDVLCDLIGGIDGAIVMEVDVKSGDYFGRRSLRNI
jgi:hypothetical protein